MHVAARVLIGLVLVAAVGYFGYMGMEGSHRLVNLDNPNTDCRTPAQLGLAYEAINYDIATDAELAAREPNMSACSAPGAAPGGELVSSDGMRLAGWWVPTAADIGPDGPTVVISHGWGSSKSGGLDDLLVFHDRYNVVLFDYRNHNQSQDGQTTQGITEQLDLLAVLDWLERTKGPGQIVVWGESMGGQTAVNVAARDPRIDALILDSTHDRLQTAMVARIRNAGYPFGEVGYLAVVLGSWIRTGVNVLSADPIEAIDDLGERPVLLLQGGADIDEPPESAERLRAAAEAAGVNITVQICPEGGHGTLNVHCPEDYARWIGEFMDQVTEP